VRREVGLVDDQKVGTADAGAPLADHVAAPSDVEDEDLGVDQGRGEGSCEVVTSRLHQH
jgi:hypothetical protein